MNSTPLAMPGPVPAPWYKHRWPWLLMLGPALVVVAGSYTIWLAFSTRDAMVVDDYYQRGKAINQDLRRDRVASRLGLSVTLRYDAARGLIEGSLAGSGATAGSVQVHMTHATQPDKDRVLRASLNGQGRFSAPLPFLEAGRWRVMVEGEQRDWRLAGTWRWPTERVFAVSADTPAVSADMPAGSTDTPAVSANTSAVSAEAVSANPPAVY